MTPEEKDVAWIQANAELNEYIAAHCGEGKSTEELLTDAYIELWIKYHTLQGVDR